MLGPLRLCIAAKTFLSKSVKKAILKIKGSIIGKKRKKSQLDHIYNKEKINNIFANMINIIKYWKKNIVFNLLNKFSN
jgi:hypothetical protein